VARVRSSGLNATELTLAVGAGQRLPSRVVLAGSVRFRSQTLPSAPSGSAGGAISRAAGEGFPCLLAEDEPRPGWVFGVAYRDDASRGGRDLDAGTVAAAVAGGAPAGAEKVRGAHVRTPFRFYKSFAAADSRAMLSSGRRAAARRCSNITIYRLISVSCSRNRSPAMLSM